MYLGIALSVAMVLFTLLILKHRQEDLQEVASRHVMQIADVIVASKKGNLIAYLMSVK